MVIPTRMKSIVGRVHVPIQEETLACADGVARFHELFSDMMVELDGSATRDVTRPITVCQADKDYSGAVDE